MRKRLDLDMLCISQQLLVTDIDTMLEIQEKIPVVTCINNIFEKKEEFNNFTCLLNCDELSAYSEEQLKRTFKKKNVFIIHDHEDLLEKAKSFGFATIYIGSENKKADFCFASLEDMLLYGRKKRKMEEIMAGIFLLIAFLLLYISVEFNLSHLYLWYFLSLSLFSFILSIYCYRVRKIWDFITYLLDAFF